MGEWLISQAQSASPFVAVFCLLVAGALWRQIVQKDRTILAVLQSYGHAMAAQATALEKGAAAAQATVQEIRDTRAEISELRIAIGGRWHR